MAEEPGGLSGLLSIHYDQPEEGAEKEGEHSECKRKKDMQGTK